MIPDENIVLSSASLTMVSSHASRAKDVPDGRECPVRLFIVTGILNTPFSILIVSSAIDPPNSNSTALCNNFQQTYIADYLQESPVLDQYQHPQIHDYGDHLN